MPSKEKLAELKKKLKDKKLRTQSPKMDCHKNHKTSVTAEELRAACDANPDHPHAEVYRNAIGDGDTKEGHEDATALPDGYILTVDSADLEALLENGSVEETTTMENGGRTLQKKFVPGKPQKSEPPKQPVTAT